MAVTAAAAAALVLAACGSGTGRLSSDVFPAGAPAGAAASSVPASGSQTLSETGSSLMAPLFALRAFLTWAVTSGTAQLARVNFQPLPPPVVTLSDAQIARIRG